MPYQPLFNDSYLRALWTSEFEAFRESGDDAALLERLTRWAGRDFQKETSAQQAFVDIFFKQTWGYTASGERPADEGYTYFVEYSVPGAGASGRMGSADLALGWFGASDLPATPQVLCEFKDVRSGLDAPQNRKGNDRSPVEQCNDYLQGAYRAAQREFMGNPRVTPAWGVVTDMNEFRLFHIDSGFGRYQRFVLNPAMPGDVSLLKNTPRAAFQRFVFSRIFRPEMLLSELGPSGLERRLQGQSEHEKAVEAEFYKDYQAYRQYVYEGLVAANRDFSGSRGDLVRLTQRFLDRCIFALYCEDMGSALNFPPNLIRDLLRDASQSSMLDRHDNFVWDRIRRLFDAMRGGGRFAGFGIERFNGGLFEVDSRLDELTIPSYLFCEPGQASHVTDHPKTLLYLSEVYDFGATEADGSSGITLYTLGRIFEQSITELEIMEAEAEGRTSLNKITKRKRNGVYYTPEPIVNYIVRQTVGERLAELRVEVGVEEYGPVTDEEARAYRLNKDGRLSEHKRIEAYLGALQEYRDALSTITIIDPACGSGAFLITALQQLTEARKWVFDEYNRVASQPALFDSDSAIKEVLRNNLYGVDVNAESVEIAKLALWLHTAVPGKPLSALDHTIRCGNSLVGPDFGEHTQLDLLDRDLREQINVFDWREAFPEVFAQGGFDIVLGNPPYVKLQSFRKVHAHVAEYLVAAQLPDGSPRFQSTQTGNFDLYLPFIEKGMALLKEGGRLGYIAPSVWLKNDYGAGLRALMHQKRWLERWVDFQSHQIFDEATTYTALQFYRKQPLDGVIFAAAPDGNLGKIDWEQEASIPYGELPANASWNLQERPAFELMQRLSAEFPTLGEVAERIFQGLITSADPIYHLKRVGQDLYEPKRGGAVVEIEDEIMHPLVAGEEARRFSKPSSNIYILFPYHVNNDGALLKERATMELDFPKAWAYLKKNEMALRQRERGKFDTDHWYQFGRTQSLDKQHLPKLLSPRLAYRLRISLDVDGSVCIDNVDVNGVLFGNLDEGYMFLGILNSSLLDYVWRRISKPFRGGYFAANKQFIAPLPIAQPDEATKSEIVAHAQKLQELHSQRRDLLAQIDRRLDSQQTSADKRPLKWLWGDKCAWRSWLEQAPFEKRSKARNDWCKAMASEFLDEQYARVQHFLNNRAGATVEARDGEVVLSVGGAAVIEGIFAEAMAPWIAAQWRHKLRQTGSASTPDAKRLINSLLRLRKTGNADLRTRVLELDAELRALEAEIIGREAALDAVVYALYGLSEAERAMVEADKRAVL